MFRRHSRAFTIVMVGMATRKKDMSLWLRGFHVRERKLVDTTGNIQG
jgi:hypothetical protein